MYVKFLAFHSNSISNEVFLIIYPVFVSLPNSIYYNTHFAYFDIFYANKKHGMLGIFIFILKEVTETAKFVSQRNRLPGRTNQRNLFY